MPTVHIRFTGSESSVGAMIHALESIEGVERVEEIGDLMPQMDDDDSSSAGLSDLAGPRMHDIEVEAPNDEGVRRVHDTAEDMGRQLDAIVEFVEEF